MTTELEKQFFETFGIERLCDKSTYKLCVGSLDCQTCKSPYYPTITDTQYLELICILGEYDESYSFNNVKKLKEIVLKGLINFYEWCIKEDFKDSFDWAEELKEKIQELFKGER